jgi:hypothetical protein
VKPYVLGWAVTMMWIGLCFVPAMLVVGGRSEMVLIGVGVVIGIVAYAIMGAVTDWARQRGKVPGIPPK